MGDPIELKIHGYELTLRLEDAEKIQVEEISGETQGKKREKRIQKALHPGYGEGGDFMKKKEETPLPEDETLTFALVGNQNCGKTTLFNQLTGSNQHVGNFPGVTVDRKDGVIRGYKNTRITDLPGIYSMSPYSSEEIVTRESVFGGEARGNYQYCGCHEHGAEILSDDSADGAKHAHGSSLNMMDELRENRRICPVNEMEASESSGGSYFRCEGGGY